jgi:hypothetical protein
MRTFAGNHPDLGPRTNDALAPSDFAPTERLKVSSSAEVSSQRVTPGQRVTITAKVTATAGVKSLVAIQMFHMSGGDPAVDKQFDDQELQPGETKTFTTVWTVPSGAKVGDYVVKVGVFRPHWGQGGKSYDYNDSAATITVGR